MQIAVVWSTGSTRKRSWVHVTPSLSWKVLLWILCRRHRMTWGLVNIANILHKRPVWKIVDFTNVTNFLCFPYTPGSDIPIGRYCHVSVSSYLLQLTLTHIRFHRIEACFLGSDYSDVLQSSVYVFGSFFLFQVTVGALTFKFCYFMRDNLLFPYASSLPYCISHKSVEISFVKFLILPLSNHLVHSCLESLRF